MEPGCPVINLPQNPRLLVVKFGGIGDYVLTTPALRALRDSYPGARIDLVAQHPLAPQVLERLELLDDIIVLPAHLVQQPDPEAAPRTQISLDLTRRLRAARYDAVLSFEHLFPAARTQLARLLVRITGATWKIGLDNGYGDFLNVRVPDAGFGALHQAEYCMAVVEAAGAVVRERRLFFPLPAEYRDQAREILRGLSRPVIAMHPGCAAYMSARRWLPEGFAQVADALYEQFGGQLLLLGGSEEADLRTQVARALESAMPYANVSGREHILLTAAIIAQCDLFIGNDSGLMHLAAAVNTPTIGIFGPTNYRAWQPYTPTDPTRSMIVRQDLPCMPCYLRGPEIGSREGCPTRDYLTTLGAEPVIDAAARMLRQFLQKIDSLSP